MPEATLRAWERRYGTLAPRRSRGGQRLYSDADVARVLRMRALIGDGLRAAQAARVVAGDGGASGGEADAGEALAERIVAAAAELDEAALQDALDTALARFTVPAALETVAVPALREIGERWAAGELPVSAEHFAANVVRGRLCALAAGWGTGAGPLCVAACAPAEEHDLPLVILCLGLRHDGWRVRFLGARTPVHELAAVLEAEPARLAVVSASTATAARSYRQTAAANGTPVVTGGAGFGRRAAKPLREAVAGLRPYGFTA